jgi:hypothetical protein
MPLAVLLAAGAAQAQERGEKVIGKIGSMDGTELTILPKDGAPVHVRVTPDTRVEFLDSGDKKLFPNPTVRDLRVGMGVQFVYGTGTLDTIAVHYVPPRGTAAGPESESSAAQAGKIKARIQSVERGGREITADVAGRTQTFRVDPSESSRLEKGDLVILTVDRDQVTRIDPATERGTVTRLSGNTITIQLAGGREETYDVQEGGTLRNVREGDRVTFEFEERSTGRKVITRIQ